MNARSRIGGDHRYLPTSGTVSGWVGVALSAGAVVVTLVDDRTLNGSRYALGALVFGVLVWCFLLRPRVVIGADAVELRNPLSSWHVPVAGVQKVEVRAVTMVYTEEGRFDGVAVGRPVRSQLRGRSVPQRSVGIPGLGAQRVSEGAAASRQPMGRLDAQRVADLVVEEILFAADQARDLGQRPRPPWRTWARLELAALLVLCVAFVVTLLV